MGISDIMSSTAGKRRSVLSRRTFVSATLAAGTAAITGAGADTAIAAPKMRSGNSYDVIVIGAGFAGLIAARECAHRGLKVLLLEARDRVGGRTFDMDYDGSHIELGGTWIHWAQGYVWEEFSRYGLNIRESAYVTAEQASWVADGKLHSGTVTQILPDLLRGLDAFCNVDGAGGRTIFPRPYDNFHNRALIEKLDGMSLADRLAQMDATSTLKDLLASTLGIGCGNDLSQGAFLDWAKWWALNDYSYQTFGDRQVRYKIREGTGALARAILADGPVDARLSTAVASVRHTATGATVTDRNGRVETARAVICTVPMTVLSTIRFDPPLHPKKIKASTTGGSAVGSKFYALIKEKIGDWGGTAPPPYPITNAFTEFQRDDGTLLVAFAPPGRYDFTQPEQAQEALRTLLPGINVAATVSHPWRDDPFSRGTWSWYRPGQLTDIFEELRRPEGVIHFASGDSANGWRGFIDGAIESGIGAARAVTTSLA